jgi:uncharacterized protein YneF (UPF0154 family)
MFLLAISLTFLCCFYFGTMLGLWFSDKITRDRIKGLRELYESEHNFLAKQIGELKNEIAKIKGK